MNVVFAYGEKHENDECRSRKVLDKRVKGALIQVFVDDMAKVPARAPERERRVS